MQGDSAIQINLRSRKFSARYLDGLLEEAGGHHHGVVNSRGDNGIEIKPLVRTAAASVPAVS
jgi:hypothetical protein